MNLRDLLETTACRNPNKVFLCHGDEQVTYSEFDKNVNRAANVFLDLGVTRGDRVCFFLPNCPEFLYGWFGLAKIGAILVPINTAYKTEEIRYIINHCEANTILVHSSLKHIVDAVAGESSFLKSFALLGKDAAVGQYVSFGSSLEKASSTLAPVEIEQDDLCEIMYTSGTTGPSKGVMMSHNYWMLNAQGFAHSMGFTANDRLFTCLPLFHANAQGYSTMGALVSQASIVLAERFSATSFWDQIRRHEATEFNFIGAMLTILSKQPESERDREHSVRIAYGTPSLGRDFRDYMERRFGVTFVSGYGLTECGLGMTQPVHGLRKEKTMGVPRQIPGAGFTNEAKIVDEQGREVPRGKVGELALKNLGITRGYFKDPELTAKVIRDGWLFTGDHAWMDEDGYFFFADRKKDVIRRRGENVSSIEVETVINAHPKVLESAVIGVPSELYDDEVKAFVILRPGEALDPVEIAAWCKDRLAYFKIPRFIEFRTELEKTPTHRIQKYKLREERNIAGESCFDLEKLGFKFK